MSNLHIDKNTVKEARVYAKEIASDVQSYIDSHSTDSVERTICRLLGMDGVNEFDVPYPNVVVDHVKEKGCIQNGVSLYIASAMKEYSLSINEIAKQVSKQELDLSSVPLVRSKEVSPILEENLNKTLKMIKKQSETRKQYLTTWPKEDRPLRYVIVATGNIYEDVTQAKAAAKAGADIVAVIRTTGQSLLDYVPYGPTTEGFGGTYATQENFKIMRNALDDISNEEQRYIHLVNYASGLCMPEMSAMGAIERLDMMLNDSLYGILFRDINMKRTFVDQFFSRVISSYAGIIINTGEDNYLTTSDAFEEAHTVIASEFINEQFAKRAYMKEELMGLGHAFEMDPALENGFLYELAQAFLARELFPNAPLKYMPPTKHMTGNIFKGYVQNALFNMVATTSKQPIHLLGMLTEAVHTPFMSDRTLAIDNAKYIQNTMKDFGSEIEFKQGGIIDTRANAVLTDAHTLLHEIKQKGMFQAIEEGTFASIKRPRDGGKGADGVFKTSRKYTNPVLSRMLEELGGASNE